MTKVEVQNQEYITETKVLGGFFVGRKTSVTVTHVPSRLKATCSDFDSVRRNRQACIEAISAELEEQHRRRLVCY